MDQLKQIIGQMVKHQFWIITGLAVVLGCAGFFVARQSLSSLFKKESTRLDGLFGDLDKVQAAVASHPNSYSQEKMKVVIDGLYDDVESAWQLQYQQQERFMKWPVNEIKSPRLVNKIKDIMPIETELTYPDEPPGISSADRRNYARYFTGQMERLAKIIGVTWAGDAEAAGGGGMSGYGGGMGGGYGDEGDGGDGYGGGYGGGMGPGGPGMAASKPRGPRDTVVWPKTSQDELIGQLKEFSGESPTVYQIYYTQENMWILEGILNIIKATNGDATENFQCVIKEIEFIRIGRGASGDAGDVDGIAAASGSGGSMYGGGDSYGGGMYGGGEGGGYGGEGGEGGEGYGGEGDEGYGGGYGGGYDGGGAGATPGGSGGGNRDPANMRYVDAQYEPVSGEDLRTKMTSGDPADAFFAVAKRIPVRMRFKIDQRKIQTFQANCGNADLMYEIRQIRVGDTTASGSAAGGLGGYGEGAGGGPGGIGAGMGGPDMGDGDDGYGGGYGSSAAAPASLSESFDTTLEVYGIVYLFNPPNMVGLGLEKVEEDTELVDTVEPSDTQPEPAENVAPQTSPTADSDADAEDQTGTTTSSDSGEDESATSESGDDADAPVSSVP